MKVLVTGAAGFLGSHIIAALLARGDEAVVFDHRLRGKCLSNEILEQVRSIEDDVFNLVAVCQAAEGCQAIFHCAAMVGVDAYSTQPAKTMETEETGLRNVCRAALAVGGARVVYASSSAVYGHAGGDLPLEEELPIAPVSNYGIAKRFNELYLASQHDEHGLQSVALRIFNIYGPHQDERLVIPRFVRRALAGEELEIYGDGAQTRDFVYVDDVVLTALACADRVAGCEIINVCSGQEVTVRNLAETIVRLTGSRSTVVWRNQPQGRQTFEVPRCFGSRRKLQQIVGDFLPTLLAEGLKRTIASATRTWAD
jgi:nucleoside-diphosphate-sugar epimerase